MMLVIKYGPDSRYLTDLQTRIARYNNDRRNIFRKGIEAFLSKSLKFFRFIRSLMSSAEMIKNR